MHSLSLLQTYKNVELAFGRSIRARCSLQLVFASRSIAEMPGDTGYSGSSHVGWAIVHHALPTQHVSSLSIQCHPAFQLYCVKRKQIEANTGHACYVQKPNSNITLRAVHHHRSLSQVLDLQRPHVTGDQTTLTGGTGATAYHAEGVTSYVNGCSRIRYPLFPPTSPKQIVAKSTLALVRKLRSEEMRVERRRRVAVVRWARERESAQGGLSWRESSG